MSTSRRARALRRVSGKFVLDDDSTLAQRRAVLERVGRMPRPRRVDYAATEVGGVRAIVATPRGVTGDRHVLYLHGGGYALGSPESHVVMATQLAKAAQAAVTVVDYRLAPEHVYPAAIDDCAAALRDLASRIDPAMITIAGDSAGGGAALATLCRLRDAGDALPACAFLMSPWTDLTGSGESVRVRAGIDPMLKAKHLDEYAQMYAGDTPLDDVGVSPLFADLAGLPPMLIQVGTDEILYSDSTRLAERAAEAGVYVELDVGDGLWHVYQIMTPVLPEANDALAHAGRFIRARTLEPSTLGGAVLAG